MSIGQPLTYLSNIFSFSIAGEESSSEQKSERDRRGHRVEHVPDLSAVSENVGQSQADSFGAEHEAEKKESQSRFLKRTFRWDFKSFITNI